MNRQTQSYLRSLFARRGIAPKHRFGQNFLIDLNIHELIVRAAELGPTDVVLEIGPGAGALTALMAETASAVIAVEIDPAMAQLTQDAVIERMNVRVLNEDALASKHTMNPKVLDNVRAGLAVAPDRTLKLVANLPYNVATPIISNLLISPELCPVMMVVTIQLELAERLKARPQTDAYSGLSVIVQALADVEIVRTLSPKVFWPKPKVESAVVKITPSPEKRARIADLAWFYAVVRRIFLHRRKNLRRVLYSAWRGKWTKPEVDAMLESIGLTGLVRAEAMNVEEFLSLADALKARFGSMSEEDEGGDDENDEGGPPDAPEPDADLDES
ncbi:MAG: dimethyladenosine transferase [Planctomycetota bacterium]|nr:dimethyladenosine transferase [Planctomycetota bacterium]